jgi:hypothetical protein
MANSEAVGVPDGLDGKMKKAPTPTKASTTSAIARSDEPSTRPRGGARETGRCAPSCDDALGTTGDLAPSRRP